MLHKYDGLRVSEILRLKKGSIRQAPLPPGSLSLAEFEAMSWEEIERELGELFEFVEVKEVRLETNVKDFRPLFWSVLMRRR